MGQLIETRYNLMIVLQLIEEVFNQLSLTVKLIVTVPFSLSVFLWRDCIDDFLGRNVLTKFRGTIGHICDNI